MEFGKRGYWADRQNRSNNRTWVVCESRCLIFAPRSGKIVSILLLSLPIYHMTMYDPDFISLLKS